MCGILGIVAKPSREIGLDQNTFLRMRDAMQARGPDDAGLFQQRNVVFAHRRLAIRDVIGGHQPWLSDDGQCVLVYNGEIYNDDQLRQELSRGGHTFRSRCDTEVVMEAYLHWGTKFVEHLRGMFALGIYDFQHDRLILARDRFGIKPLFMAEVDGALVFASSIAAILQHPHMARVPNMAAISHYLTTFRITLGSHTLFDGIQQLQPGEILVSENGAKRISRYWDYPLAEDDSIGYEEAAQQLEATLTESVTRRLVSDVPVGAFISGGVDSNTILSLMRIASPQHLKTYCGGGGDNSPDFKFAKRCADHLDCDYDELHVGPQEYLETWHWLVETNALPLSTPTDVILYRLAKHMQRSLGVALGGEGADELLCGYAVQHWSGNDFDAVRSLQAGRWSGSPTTARLFISSLRRQYGRARFDSETDHYFAINSLIPENVKPHLLQPWVWNAAGRDEPTTQHYSALFAARNGECTARKHAAVLHHVNLEGLLARLDSSTMAAGLEARVPFTDHILVERMFRVPTRHKIDVAGEEQAPYLASEALQQRGSLHSKRLLRTVASRFLPCELAQRRKASFPTSVAQWLAGPWKGWAAEKLLHSPFARNIFQPAALQELANNVEETGMWMWPILNLSLWGDRHFNAA